MTPPVVYYKRRQEGLQSPFFEKRGGCYGTGACAALAWALYGVFRAGTAGTEAKRGEEPGSL